MALKARAHESDLRSGGGDQRQELLQATGIDFSQLVEPYRGYGKLTLRLEQLPSRARFSAGMRAGERSWSLTPDDLNGLKYLLPDGVSVSHTVKVRVIGMERGDTLAVLDVKVSDYIRAATNDAPQATSAQDSQTSGDQLAKAQSAVGALQIQLSDALNEISRLRATDTSETANSAIEAARATWLAEQTRLVAELEADWKARSQKQLDEVQTQLTSALRDLQRAATVQAEALATQIATARADWKAEEARRLSAAEADWARQSEEKISELQAQLSDARRRNLKLQTDTSSDRQAELDAAHAEWKEEEAKRLAKAEAQWASRSRERIEDLETQLSELQATYKRLSSEIAADGKADLDAARSAWKAEEVARLAQSEASWSEQVEYLKAELAKARTSQATVDTEDLQAQLRQIREELQTGFDQKLALAQAEWDRMHAALMKSAEQDWAARIASLERQLESERAAGAQSTAPTEDTALKTAIASLQAALAERDTAYDRLNKQLETERQARRKELQELRASHEAASQAEVELREQHAATLEQSEARWKLTSAAEVRAALTRAEQAEAKLEGLRAAAADAARLDKEVVMLRATLVEREQELHRLQHLPAPTPGTDDATGTPPAPTGFKRVLATPYLREGLVGAACTVATILLLPGLEQNTTPSEPSAVAQVMNLADNAPQSPGLLQSVAVLRNTRLRVAPAKDAQALFRVERGVEVGVLKTEGGWTNVKMNYKTKVAIGWIENESLALPAPAANAAQP